MTLSTITPTQVILSLSLVMSTSCYVTMSQLYTAPLTTVDHRLDILYQSLHSDLSFAFNLPHIKCVGTLNSFSSFSSFTAILFQKNVEYLTDRFLVCFYYFYLCAPPAEHAVCGSCGQMQYFPPMCLYLSLSLCLCYTYTALHL